MDCVRAGEGGAARAGFALLDREALRAVATWRFLPKLVDGAPVVSTLEVPVRFELK